MPDIVLKVVAFAVVTVFVVTIPFYVPRLDLGIVTAVTVALIAWDFFAGPRRG